MQQLAVADIRPKAPNFAFRVEENRRCSAYDAAPLLSEAMPVHVTAPVTARDRFVTAFSREELLERMEAFRDLSISDDAIRRRWFTRTRSSRHLAGDTRGWSLSEARRWLAEQEDWQSLATTCLYRPFDVRAILWHRQMIDWPRTRVTRHLTGGDNLALITRRQSPPGAWTYSFITDRLALDGVIRSDNRGSESLFPLYLYDEEPNSSGKSRARRPNFSETFVEQFAIRLGLPWREEGGDLEHCFGPDDLLHYIYALLQAEGYRRRYRESLQNSFPRVSLPAGLEVFRTLSEAGERLKQLHVRPQAGLAEVLEAASDRDLSVAPGFPRRRDGRIEINRHAAVAAGEDVWRWRVGGHQAARKWLRDRRGRTLDEQALRCYAGLLAAAEGTLAVTNDLERVIANRGGWEKCFVS